MNNTFDDDLIGLRRFQRRSFSESPRNERCLTTRGNNNNNTNVNNRHSCTSAIVVPSPSINSICSSTTQQQLYVSNCFRDKRFKRLEELYASGTLCDVTLQCKEVTVQAHRVVLAACSDYFAAMFTNGMTETVQNVINIGSLDQRALSPLIDFMYSGSIEVNENSVEYLLSGACLLQMNEVSDACCTYLINQLHPANCLGIRTFAQSESCLRLSQFAHRFILDHFVQVTQTQEFLSLNVTEIATLLEDEELNVPSEVFVYNAMLGWLNYDIDNRKQFVSALLPCIRLPLLSTDFLADHIENNALFREDTVCRNVIIEALKYHLLRNRRNQLQNERTKPRKSTVGTMFAVGGMDSNKGAAMTIEEYCLLRDEWTVVGNMNGRRLQFGIAVIDSCLCIVGGRDGLKTMNNFEVWDCATRTWNNREPMHTPRHGLGVSVLEGPLYAVGGHDGWSYLSCVERYDTKSRSWTYIADMQTARSTLGVVALNGKLYAIGGRDGSQCLKSVECYNPHTNKWTFVCNMNRRRGGVGVGTLNGCIYAVGGIDAPSSNPSSARFQCVERYDPQSDTWNMIANLMTGRDAIGVCSLGSFLFSVGGYDGSSYSKMVQYYDPEKNEWKQASDLCSARGGSCLVVLPIIPKKQRFSKYNHNSDCSSHFDCSSLNCALALPLTRSASSTPFANKDTGT